MQRDGDATNDADVSSSAPAAEADAPVEISWDVDASPEADEHENASEPAGISWDVDADPASAVEPGAMGISWDVDMDSATMVETGEAAGESGTDAPGGIDWDVEVADQGAAGKDAAEGINIDWDIGGGAGGAEPDAPTANGADSGQTTDASDLTAALMADSDFRTRFARERSFVRIAALSTAHTACITRRMQGPKPRPAQAIGSHVFLHSRTCSCCPVGCWMICTS